MVSRQKMSGKASLRLKMDFFLLERLMKKKTDENKFEKEVWKAKTISILAQS